ncbi:4-hydroxy-tetrahydrodipicolinate synthase [Flavobacteriales bacterium]|nr:4-hydroxy-tetrahydrodipicolinate synthase [Flavobacteriales bacterium]MDB4051860.1 4-hydroxy-tetrahydrodipicolinate synthase [Flavobacteriales bacterium]MDB4195672.1 4-hydroxy-tetrahydrodipicolinate synthase [Flavobacteriales bacterium]
MSKLKGLGVAMVTPFKSNKEIDFPALEKLTNKLIDGGLDYLVVMGTTAESATLSFAEKQQVLDFVLKINKSRLPIVFGIGGNDTIKMVKEYNSYNLDGVDAILSASPYYNKPSQEGIYQHYKYLSENMTHDIILYNVPGRTASNMTAETTVRLANDFKNIVAIKEASGDLNQVMHIINNRPNGFLLISGDDALTLPMIACGAEGLISVIANSHPLDTKNLVAKSMIGDFNSSRKSHYKLLNLIDGIFSDGNPGGVKVLLNEQGVMENEVRLPLVPVNKNLEAQLRKMN